MMNNKDIESKRPTLFLLGLISALSLTLMAFEWRTTKDMVSCTFDLGPDDDFIEKVMPAVIIEKTQKAKANQIQQKRKESRSNRFEVVADDMRMMEKGPALTNLKLSSPNRPAKKNMDREMLRPSASTRSVRGLLPHELPYMRACGHITDDIARFQCTQVELRKHVVSNFRMPSSDQIKDLPARVEVTFTINRYGLITDITPDKEYHSSLSTEIERVMSDLPELVPATVSGNRISVRFELPIVLERY